MAIFGFRFRFRFNRLQTVKPLVCHEEFCLKNQVAVPKEEQSGSVQLERLSKTERHECDLGKLFSAQLRPLLQTTQERLR